MSVLPLHAQLSPGELHKTHAFLEGLKNCTQCHSAGNQVSTEKCLDCHTLLKERIAAKKGLHANPDYKECGVCHSEHQGRQIDLVRWKEGQDKFDHNLTGYKLEGAHIKVKCRKCHNAENIPNPAPLLAKEKILNRTFLGLSPGCVSCHVDEHRGQLGLKCFPCHSMDRWIPAPGFDHNNTKYPLTGKHAFVACKNCHPTIADNRLPADKSFLKFTGIPFSRCTDCHQDVHRGQLGNNCESCHSTAGWGSVPEAKFDHDKTRYPLKGKHKQVRCESCHQPGRPHRGIPFQFCRDCHADFHRGQFAHRVSKGACEECHTVEGYSPSTFTVEDHQKSAYPLKGAHAAIPCIFCHAGESSQNGGISTTSAENTRSMLKVNRFDIKFDQCQNCHKDPHRGEVDKFIRIEGCEYCHRVESWQASVFNHSQTAFDLEGRHAEITCRPCHQPVDAGTSTERLKFSGMPLLCQDCHTDIHYGQFIEEIVLRGKSLSLTNCYRCHTPLSRNWEAVKFDHNRDSKFPLEWMHQKVPCQHCHYEVEQDSVKFALYKPLGTECKTCHGGS